MNEPLDVEALTGRYGPMVLRRCRQLLGDEDEAMDACQDVFVRLLERRVRSLGYPVLLGPSRKSFIGFTLDLPPDQRVEGTAATIAIGIARGADIVRVHDVRETARVAKMTDAIVRK